MPVDWIVKVKFLSFQVLAPIYKTLGGPNKIRCRPCFNKVVANL